MALFVGVVIRGEGPGFQFTIGRKYLLLSHIVFKNFEIIRAI